MKKVIKYIMIALLILIVGTLILYVSRGDSRNSEPIIEDVNYVAPQNFQILLS